MLSAIDHHALDNTDYVMVIGSQAATAVLVFNAYHSPLAQPRNVLLGNTVAAFCGVATRKMLSDDLMWIGVPLSVALALLAMDVTRSVHPPAGTKPLITRACLGVCHGVGSMSGTYCS